MPPELRLAVASYLDARSSRTCQTFFVSKNDRPLSDSQFRRVLRGVGDAAGVKFFAHALRHSYITLLLRSRVPLHIVQSLAGHADLETTQRYTAVWDEDKRAAAQRLRLTSRH
jgi:site-specific recombinase XerD